MRVAIITPTTGSPLLGKCVESVRQQTYKNTEHFVVVDGKNRWETADAVLRAIEFPNGSTEQVCVLPHATGKDGWYGHRVYAAFPFLVDADAVMFLDQDNWIDPTHVESMVKAVENNDWAYSLRKIYGEDETFICEDNCESLGEWSVWFDENVKHIDTSCFIVKTKVAVQVCQAWYGKWGQDRVFFHTLAKYFRKFQCTGHHTLCYRLGGNEGSVKADFFTQGNDVMAKKYNNNFPWRKP